MKMEGDDYCLAIIGSRNFDNSELFQEGLIQVFEMWGLPTKVVSGGAKGADTFGEQWAKANDIECIVYKPDWKKHGRKAGILRNTDIINECDKVLAFPSQNGKGTQDSIKKAKQKNKDSIIIWC